MKIVKNLCLRLAIKLDTELILNMTHICVQYRQTLIYSTFSTSFTIQDSSTQVPVINQINEEEEQENIRNSDKRRN